MEANIALFATACTPTPTNSHRGLFSKNKVSGVSTHLHLVPNVKKEWSYLCILLKSWCDLQTRRTTILLFVKLFLSKWATRLLAQEK
jgi:hypothetical protein